MEQEGHMSDYCGQIMRQVSSGAGRTSCRQVEPGLERMAARIRKRSARHGISVALVEQIVASGI